MHRGDIIVVVLAVSVVGENFSSALDNVFYRKRSASLDYERLLENGKRETEVAVGFSGKVINRIFRNGNVRKSFVNPTDIGEDIVFDIFVRKRLEDEHLRAGKKRPNDREAGIFCRRANEGYDSLFHVRKKGILLGLVPAVDFVQKKNRPLSFKEVFPRFRNDLRKVFFFTYDPGKVEKIRFDRF